MKIETRLTGRYVMRAVDEFWGEYWPVGHVARMEVSEVIVNVDKETTPISILDEIHIFDSQGALVEYMHPCDVLSDNFSEQRIASSDIQLTVHVNSHIN